MTAQQSTVLDFIVYLMTNIGAINQGETPNASEQAFVFFALNQRIDQWNARSTYIYQAAQYTMPLVANQQSYAVGPGGSGLNVSPRPLIRHASVLLNGTTITEALELIGSAGWNSIEDLAMASQRPQKIYPDYAWPVMNVQIWPKPSLNMTLTLYVWQRLAQFAAITDVINLPEGYYFALMNQVSMDVIPGFQRQIEPQTLATIAQAAQTAEADIQQLNVQLLRGLATGPVPDSPVLPPGASPNLQPEPGSGGSQ